MKVISATSASDTQRCSSWSLHAATTTGLALALASVLGWSARGDVERTILDPTSVDDAALQRSGDPLG